MIGIKRFALTYCTEKLTLSEKLRSTKNHLRKQALLGKLTVDGLPILIREAESVRQSLGDRNKVKACKFRANSLQASPAGVPGRKSQQDYLDPPSVPAIGDVCDDGVDSQVENLGGARLALQHWALVPLENRRGHTVKKQFTKNLKTNKNRGDSKNTGQPSNNADELDIQRAPADDHPGGLCQSIGFGFSQHFLRDHQLIVNSASVLCDCGHEGQESNSTDLRSGTRFISCSAQKLNAF
ncbi:hypothetical protein RRG08_024138 [Elysia crispata]|uniref:Uncharacterized protein n=1 Tax=Elysia crispata TaxID=231223 RepID=A0AAE0YQU3_9GAST|nr:hypothetical protein RRG08_024138 [Elysia crispata]